MAKYCTQCGRKLEEGEICNCTSQNAGNMQRTNGQPNAQQRQQYQEGQQYQQGQPNAQQGQQYQYGPGQQNAQQQYYQSGQQNFQQQYYQQGQAGGTTKEAEWLNRQKDAIISGTKNMFSEIIPILKSPVSRVRQISASNSSKAGVQLIAAKAIIFLIVVIIALIMISNRISQISYGLATPSMPYFQMILLTILMTAGIDFLEALLLKTITGAFNGVTNVNTMINIIGARCIYDTITFLIVIALGLIAWEAAFAVLALLSPISIYIQFSAYQGCVNLKADRMPYAYFVTKLCTSVISFLVIYLIIRSYFNTVVSYMFNGIF